MLFDVLMVYALSRRIMESDTMLANDKMKKFLYYLLELSVHNLRIKDEQNSSLSPC
jgi:hypothetical protein